MNESKIRTAIKNYLQILENQGKLVFQYNNSGAMVSQYKGKTSFLRFGKSGSPDFYVWINYKNNFCPYLLTLFREVKIISGKQNKNQIEFQKKIEAIGGDYKIWYSLDDCISDLKQYGI